MKNLEELFEHQLQDLYSAEDQLTDALPKMAKKAKDAKLKTAIEDHLEETKEHKNRLKEICDELDIDPKGETCKAMKGLIKEAESFMDEADDDDVLNAGMIAEAQRVEHYEISGYGTAVAMRRNWATATLQTNSKKPWMRNTMPTKPLTILRKTA